MDEAQAYAKHRNLKAAAAELGVPWQSLYVRLRKAGVAITGDKQRYGAARDRTGAKGEEIFKGLVPIAEDLNRSNYQSKFDFVVCGFTVDVKTSHRACRQKPSKSQSWSFSVRKQSAAADFFACVCLSEDGGVERILLVPGELAYGMQTISVSCTGNSKWLDYEVAPTDVQPFFVALQSAKAA